MAVEFTVHEKTGISLCDGWRVMEEDELPDSIFQELDKRKAFQYPGGWSACIRKEETGEWAVVTNNGAFYKVNAEYMLWTSDGKCRAAWSGESLVEAIKMHCQGKLSEWDDPDYET